ncbi:GDSL esterase/lipase At4g10955-like [Papaver somniferum]|uniref:GDSL esterase/lipase At4g10955-like n=1 Tax=Papaver somniferum TaxID=3469 RepID=UPI000E6FA0C2|nr:GDSL esterase/lipase At4g10955-like [Papaver somniferum]
MAESKLRNMSFDEEISKRRNQPRLSQTSPTKTSKMKSKKIRKSPELMASARKEGPVNLTTVDWQNVHHRRIIAASLVCGSYFLEHDRQENRQGCEALAPQWWEFFNFQLLYPLIDSNDFSIFGAVYEYKPVAFNKHQTGIVPRYIIAFRGTTIKKQSVSQDLWLDLNIIKHGLHQSTRYNVAMEAVQNMVSAVGASNVWLAGHSLGSSIAMLVGKNMAKTGNYLESYLFNTPFIAAPIEKIQSEKVKRGARFAGSLVKAGLTVAMKGSKENRSPDDSFTALAAWVPKLFVNPADHICCEYIGYFEHRDRMEYLGVSGIEKLAMQTSVTGLLKSAIGRESEVIHVVPSASLTINRSPSWELPTFMQAHGIQQWLKEDLRLNSKVYQYRL